MAGVSTILSPEKRIELNPYDVDAWNLLLREAQTKPIDYVRDFYEKLVNQFPNAGRYWKAYIEHELRGKNFEFVEKIFHRCLVKVLNIDLWKCYLFYVRETKGQLASFREKMAQAYDFAVEKVGLDMHCYSIFAEYVSFLKTVPAVGQYAENQRISAVRKIFQKGIVTPMLNIEQLWAEYCSFEKSTNSILAEKLISERNRDYQTAKRVSRQLEDAVRGLNRQTVSIPPSGSASELKQIDLWKKYINWEKSNPVHCEDYVYYTKRVTYAYEQALLCLGFHPDFWYESALFQQQAAKILADKGDTKNANIIHDDISALYERATSTLLKDCQLLYFAYADYEEERVNFDKVRQIYDRLIDMPNIDPTLTYIHKMRFVRRTEGVKLARAVFKSSREDVRCRFPIFVAAALIEYYCNKDTNIAMRVFDLGLKKFGHEPDYGLAYVDFLSHLNEDNNTRVLFERILTSDTMSDTKSIEIWDRYLEFESQVGDLSSILKVDTRRRDSLNEHFGDMQTLLLIDRYRFLNLVPCTFDQLKLLGYTPKQLKHPWSGGHAASGGSNERVGSSQNGSQQVVKDSTHMTSSRGSGHQQGSLDGTAYPRPDVHQMVPFKPRIVTTSSYHPVSGGVFPPPPAVASLMQMLPPPWSFNGPFVGVDLLMDEFRRYQGPQNAPKVDPDEKPENGVVQFGVHKMDDIKKEFYQLLATTPDPALMLASGDYSQTKKRKVEGDSDEDEANVQASSKDVYRMRMHKKAA